MEKTKTARTLFWGRRERLSVTCREKNVAPGTTIKGTGKETEFSRLETWSARTIPARHFKNGGIPLSKLQTERDLPQ